MTSVREAHERFTPLNLSEHDNPTPTSELDAWRDKVIHGKFPLMVDDPYIDTLVSFQWTVDGHLYPETEGFMMAIQDKNKEL